MKNYLILLLKCILRNGHNILYIIKDNMQYYKKATYLMEKATNKDVLKYKIYNNKLKWEKGPH
jgi:hypothetical protein